MGLRIAFIVLMIGAWPMSAEVREIQSMQEILAEIDDDTIVFFDIDNTLIMPVDGLGSDQHFYFIRQRLEENYKISREEASKKAEQIWNLSQRKIKTKPVELSTPELIANLQKNKAKLFALTARTFSIADITREQLWQNGIDFARQSLVTNEPLIIDDHSVYTQGIVYQGEGNDKGKTLLKFLAMFNLKPKKIVFVDDKEHNVINVHNALEAIGIRHIEYRYAATDKAVYDFIAQSSSAEFMSKADLFQMTLLEELSFKIHELNAP